MNSQNWSTVGSLPNTYQTSDQCAFSIDDHVYVVGGYNSNCTSLDIVYRMTANVTDNVNSTLDGNVIETLAPLDQPRGDVSCVYENTFAYASGGFTHENNFCEPLGSVERYSVDTDSWDTIASLNTPRADKVLVSMNRKLFSVGGERQIEGLCEIDNEEDLPDPGEQTVAVDGVEVYENGEWSILSSLPEHRFRFAAIAWEPSSTIYIFGGQVAYNDECQCFATTNQVVAYIDDESSTSSVCKLAMAVTTIVGTFVTILIM